VVVSGKVPQIKDLQCRTAEDEGVGIVETVTRGVLRVEQKPSRVERLMGMLGTGGEAVDAPGRRDEPAIIDGSTKRGVSDERSSLSARDVPLLPVGHLGQVAKPVAHAKSVT
jgi:hypothetical protein